MTHIYDDTLKGSAEKARRPLVGMDPEIETFLYKIPELAQVIANRAAAQPKGL